MKQKVSSVAAAATSRVIDDASDGEIGFTALDDNVHLQIFKFCDLESLRSMMEVNRRCRNLIATSKSIWVGVCCEQWNWLKKHVHADTNQEDPFDLVDHLNFPTSFVDISNSWNLPNISFLLSLVGPYASSSIDESLLTDTDEWDEDMELVLIPLASGDSAVQFVGTVGPGDRCIRADQPLPRPTKVLAEGSERARRQQGLSPLLQQLSRFPTEGHQCMTGQARHRSMPGFWADEHFLSGNLDWKPFVAPYMCRGDNHHLTVNLTPRLVAYYEVSILDPVKKKGTLGCIAVGIAMDRFQLHGRMPGWDRKSFGYHGDDGGIYHDAGHMFRSYGPKFGPGDTIGCGIDYASRAIFFTKNGTFLGNAFGDVRLFDPVTRVSSSGRHTAQHLPPSLQQFTIDGVTEWYPVVGLDSNAPVVCNFGQTPFAFDLDAYQKGRPNRPYYLLTD